MKSLVVLVLLVTLGLFAVGCEYTPKADEVQKEQTEAIMQEINRQVGMPEIVNFQEKKWAKLIFELRDQSDLVTYAYTQSDVTGKFVYMGMAIGYGLPYSVQYTNPQRLAGTYRDSTALPQADPNGLFMPDGLSATWLMMIDEETGDVNPLYVEPTITVSPHKLPRRLVEEWSLPSDY